MPYKDPKDRKEWTRRWKKKSKENGYNQWLYLRRKLRFIDAEEFKRTLEFIALNNAGGPPGVVATAALTESAKRWATLGEPPHRQSIPEEEQDAEAQVFLVDGDGHREGETLAEALDKLGLS